MPVSPMRLNQLKLPIKPILITNKDKESYSRSCFISILTRIRKDFISLPDRTDLADFNIDGINIELKNWYAWHVVHTNEFLNGFMARKLGLIIGTDRMILPNWNWIPIMRVKWGRKK